jgi:peptidyl-prolyl isomerase E (cyclophilin E)
MAGKHRGYGFVEYVEPEDAIEAIENMNDSELFGRTLKVNVAKPTAVKSRAGSVPFC